ncbi:GntR family transcriptional regulator [Rhodobacteraceae bacterium CCMM004]|nr:GntR family transcriptional regulator [Rhodobacteraceae bacterium CCMM004]
MAGSGRRQSQGSGASRTRLVREDVLKEVRRAIASGALPPGARLTERALCETHGISRTAAREVIRQLDAERLGEAVPHQGLRITKLTEKTVREIYQVRAELEVMIIRAFVARATDRQIAHLKVILDRLDHAIRHCGPHTQIAHSTRYITYMAEIADNTIAEEMLAHLNARIELVRALSLSRPGQVEEGMAQLDLVRQRIVAGDADGAEAEIRRYIEVAMGSAMLQLKDDAG